MSKTTDAERIKELEQAIQDIDKMLQVPAAEYVPAIRDVFARIDAVKVKRNALRRSNAQVEAW